LLQGLLQVKLGRVLYRARIRSYRLKAKFPWENGLLFLDSVLSVSCVIRESHRPDEVSLDGKVSEALKHDWGHRGLDVVRKTVLKEVQTVLAIHAVLSYDVGRVDSIAEELDSDPWRHVLLCIVDFEGRAQTNKSSITSAEHASVGMVSQADPSGLSHIANAMEGFYAAVKLIALLIEASSRFNLEVLV